MLLEMLASERSGEEELHVGEHFGRDLTADSLCDEGLAARFGAADLVFTGFGRHVAEHLAFQILGRCVVARLAS